MKINLLFWFYTTQLLNLRTAGMEVYCDICKLWTNLKLEV